MVEESPSGEPDLEKMFLYQVARIAKIEKKQYVNGQAGREIVVEALRPVVLGARVKIRDPDAKVTPGMQGKFMDVALLVPSASFEVYREAKELVARSPGFQETRRKHAFSGFVKQVYVRDIWHAPERYNHLLLVDSGIGRALINADDITFDEVRVNDLVKVKTDELCVLDVKDHFTRAIEQNLAYLRAIEESCLREPEREMSSYSLRAIYTRQIGIAYLALGDRARGLEWLGKASEIFDRSWVKGNDDLTSQALWTIYTAVLSRDVSQMRRAAEGIRDMKYKRWPDGHYTASFLSSLILGNDDEASQIAARFEERERTSGPRASRYYKGLGTLCFGIASRDARIYREGMDRVLRSHKGKAAQYGPTYDQAMVCFPATALALLAKDRGLLLRQEDIDEKLRGYILWGLME